MAVLKSAFIITSITLSLALCHCAFADLAEDGIGLYNARHYKEALTALEEASVKRKNDPNVLYYLALAQQQTGQIAKSRSTFLRIVSIAPTSGAARYARQALGLPPAGSSKTSISSPAITSPAAGEALPFDCPVRMFPGGKLQDATDTPALAWGFKKIKILATTTPKKALAHYESELANNKNWKLKEKQAAATSTKTNPEGNRMCGEIVYLSQSNSGWAKEMTIMAEAPDPNPTSDIGTIIEITLFNESHYQ